MMWAKKSAINILTNRAQKVQGSGFTQIQMKGYLGHPSINQDLVYIEW